MPSLFDQMAQAASPMMAHHLGEAATYTPDGGQAVAVEGVLVGVEQVERVERDDRRMVHSWREASIPASAVSAVNTLATLTIGGREFKITRILGRDAAWTRVMAERWAVAEVAHADYRMEL